MVNCKIIVFAVVASFCILSVSALPIAEEIEAEILVEESIRGARHRRVTCDLLSASINGNQLNHSACAAHCLFQKYKGGYCANGVCHCRR